MKLTATTLTFFALFIGVLDADEDAANPAPADSRANPMALPAPSADRPTKPLPELQKAYAKHEAAAARQARDLRDFISNRRPGLSDKDFAREQQRRREQLAAAVRESFAARQQMLAAELEALKSKIADTQHNLEVRNKVADQIVARRVEDLLNSELRWDARATTELSNLAPPFLSSDFSAKPSQIPSGYRLFTIDVDETQFAGERLSPGDKVDVIMTYDLRTPDGMVTASVPVLERVGVLEAQGETRSDAMTWWHVSLIVKADEVYLLELAQRKGRLSLVRRNPLDKTVHISKAATDQLMAALRAKENNKPLAVGDEQLFQKPTSRDQTPGGRSAGYEFGASPPPRGQTVDAGRANSPAGSAESDLSRPSTSTSNRKPRRWVADGLDDLRAQKLIERIGNGHVQGGPNGAEFQFDATDEEFQEFQAAVQVETAKARQETEARQRDQRIALLTGIWDPAEGQDDMERAAPLKLVIHGSLAATFDGNERKRLWRLDPEQEGAYRFQAADGRQSMQGTYTTDTQGQHLAVVSLGQNGAEIVKYNRTIAAVPPEWIAEMETGASKASDSTSNANRSNQLLRGTQTGTMRRQSQAVGADQAGRKPSDYLELVEPYARTLAERDRLQKTIGATHPEIHQRTAEFERAAKAIEFLKKEFQAELDAAAGQVELKRAELSAAKVKLEQTSTLYDRKVLSRSELQLQELALKQVESRLQAAESRLKLFQATKDELFPATSSTEAPATPTSPQTRAAVPATPAAPKPTSPPTQPAAAPQSPATPAPAPAPQPLSDR